MFYIVKEIRSESTVQIARDLDRDYEAVLNFVDKVQDVSGDMDEFDLYDVCEADEIYVTAGEKGLEDEDSSPRSADSQNRTRRLRIRQATRPDTRPSALAPSHGCLQSRSS